MALSRAERFRLKNGILDEIASPDGDWDLRRQNVLLAEFGLPPIDWDGPTFGEQLGAINERDLLEMYGIVLGVELADVRGDVEDSDAGNWKAGYVRLFVSHSARHREFVGEIADELAVAGIHGFVAHDTMEYSKPWQAQIEQALRSMQAFVALVHPEFNDSAWCQQEVGWAFGRRVPRYAVRLGKDPAGFIGSDQWPSGPGQTAKQVAHTITSWVAREEGLGSSMVEGLFNALRSAGNYYDAEASGARIAALGNLTSEQWTELEVIFWQNDQIYGSVLANRALRPLFDQNRRPFPPPQPPPY